MIFNLIYTSTRSESFFENNIESILNTSVENNQSKNITGLLAYHDDKFIQILEGDEETVNALFDIISADQRHCFIQKVFEGYSPERHFPDWAMAFKKITEQEYDVLKGMLPLNFKLIKSHTLIKDSKHSPIFAILKQFLAGA